MGYPAGVTDADIERHWGAGDPQRIDSADMDPIERHAEAEKARRTNAAIAAAEPLARADLQTFDEATRMRVMRWLSREGGDSVLILAWALMRNATTRVEGLESLAYECARVLRDDYIQSRSHRLAEDALLAEDNAAWRAAHACQHCRDGYLDVGLKNGRPVPCDVCHGYGAVAV